MVERFLRDIIVYLREGSFRLVRELESSITPSRRCEMHSRLSTFRSKRLPNTPCISQAGTH